MNKYCDFFNCSLVVRTSGVLHCWWSSGRASCHVTQNYYFDNEVSYYLQVRIPSTTNEGEDIYSCWHDGSQADRVETCSFNTQCTRTEGKYTGEGSLVCF